VLDAGAHFLIWLGRDLASRRDAAAIRGACARCAAALAAGRFPLPELRTVSEARLSIPFLSPLQLLLLLFPLTHARHVDNKLSLHLLYQ
jgi:hypothetical protein